MAIAANLRNVFASTPSSRASVIVATDGELLMRFVRHRDHQAFAQIVERHGRLVWMVCRQVLGHHQDVEDAFQATFLILAERARTIRVRDSAASWLYKVAMRTALSARRKRARRREEALVAEPPAGETAIPRIDEREMLYVLLQELESLPQRYQTPLVMRYFEGLSRQAIAEQTDSTVAQVQGRLARGRRLLRSRFLRRGVSLSLAASTIAGAATSAKAAVTPSRIAGVAEGCAAFRVSNTTGGLSPLAILLAKEGVKAMWFSFVAKCAVVVTTVVFTAGIVWAAQQGAGNGKNAAGSPAKGIDLKVATGERDDAKKGPIAAPPAASRTAATANQRQDLYMLKVSAQLDEQRDQLEHLLRGKSKASARFDIDQLEKSALQREVEHMQNWLVELNSPPVTSSGEKLGEEAQKKRAELRDTVVARLESAKKNFEDQTLKMADASAVLEQLQSSISQAQRRLEELDRLSFQLGIARDLSRMAAEIPDAAPVRSDAAIKPGDSIRISVAGTPADAPIDGVFPVETMGTVALGPVYGRTKVEGLSVLDAEKAIKKSLGEIIQEPMVQVTLCPKGDSPGTITVNPADGLTETTAQFIPATPGTGEFQLTPAVPNVAKMLQSTTLQIEDLQRALKNLKVENAELKKQLEQRRKQSSETLKADDPSGKIRPGDQILVALFDKKSGAKSLQIVTIDKNGEFTLGSAAVRLRGMDGRLAEEAIRKALEPTYPEEEIRVEVSHSGDR